MTLVIPRLETNGKYIGSSLSARKPSIHVNSDDRFIGEVGRRDPHRPDLKAQTDNLYQNVPIVHRKPSADDGRKQRLKAREGNRATSGYRGHPL